MPRAVPNAEPQAFFAKEVGHGKRGDPSAKPARSRDRRQSGGSRREATSTRPSPAFCIVSSRASWMSGKAGVRPPKRRDTRVMPLGKTCAAALVFALGCGVTEKRTQTVIDHSQTRLG